MHVGKFSASIEEFLEIFQRHKVDEQLNSMIAALQNQINSPQDPNVSSAFKVSYEAFLNSYPVNETMEVPPLMVSTWREMGAEPYIGHEFQERVTKILVSNNVTPQIALQELSKLRDEFGKYFNALRQVDSAFSQLSIEHDPVAPQDFEFAIAFPREVVPEKLQSLQEELRDLNNAIRAFEELSENGVGSSRLKIISSTDWQFYFQMTALVAACVAHAIERIVQLYKANLEITKLKLEIEKLKVASKNIPEAALKPLEEFLREVIKEEIGTIASDLVKAHYRGDKGRKNELTTSVRFAVHYLADRIDRGVTVQVVAIPPEEPKGTDADGKELSEIDKSAEIAAYSKAKELASKVSAQGRALVGADSGNVQTLRLEKQEPHQ